MGALGANSDSSCSNSGRRTPEYFARPKNPRSINIQLVQDREVTELARQYEHFTYTDWHEDPRMPTPYNATATAPDSQYLCMTCGALETSLARCLAHMRTVCQLGQMRFRCTECGRAFKYLPDLTEHFRRWHVSLYVSLVFCVIFFRFV